MQKDNIFYKIYKELYQLYGPQGWWPLTDLKSSSNPGGYHPLDYSYPKTSDQIFEICVGAILTQNTKWSAVQKVLENLKKENLLNPKKILKLNSSKLQNLIKSSGYFSQKSKKLKIFSKYFINLKNKIPSRESLLSLWGIGPETADSILLYAFKVPTFVVDSYTKKIFSNLSIIDQNFDYEKIKNLFQANLYYDFRLYQEYHALIVEHAKRYYLKSKHKILCPLYKKFVK